MMPRKSRKAKKSTTRSKAAKADSSASSPKPPKQPKGESRKIGALKRYKITSEQLAKSPDISSILKRAVGSRERIIDALRFSSDPGAIQFLEIYDACPQGDRNYLPLEAFCIKSEVSPAAVLGAVLLAAKSVNAQESALILVMEHPRVMRKTVEFATELPGASADRKMLHEIAGCTPSKGGGISVNLFGNNAQVVREEVEIEEADGSDEDQRVMRNAFPLVSRELESWGEERRKLLIEGNS